jgi:hypothetical protein
LFSNTGSTDLRLTEVQQPNTTATLSWRRSCLAFSANRSQFEAGSTTTGSIFLPMTPPLALISSNAIMQTSRSDTSLIAMVPDSECSTPTLTVPPPCARKTAGKPMPAAAPRPTAPAVLRKLLRDTSAIPVSFHSEQ